MLRGGNLANNDDFFERDHYLRVIKLRPLFPVPLMTLPPVSPIINPALLSNITKPVLEMKLEDGSIFRMGGIPQNIALEIWEVLERKKLPAEMEFERVDPRLTLSQVITELAEVKRVRITDILPQYNVYVAELDLIPEGFGKPVTLQMVPSHAILVALRARAEIYVSRSLIENIREEEEELEGRREDEGYYDV